ncbi:NAD(P)/FAD-dependent oxidoreductase [Alkalihalobacterium elongatum]|uniref:NAD(P)/FAD-dependent oxidoreductase n=1 Tax=Alkalihalobacterium elongatum TaxID=2675466 RepID=UPI001C1F95A7|nr:FAD-dependent oxidoreductase [Alkalihalobacterium elongatum]
MEKMNHYSVIIVGAGLAGIIAAKKFSEENVNYLVLDKGRSVGGRMATRRVNGGRSDHGAQFFTARSEQMKELVNGWVSDRLVHTWTNGFHQMNNITDLDSLLLHNDGYPRYAGKNGMNALIKELARDLNIKIEHKVEKIEWIGGKWSVSARVGKDAEMVSFTTDRLLLTSPTPQSLELLAQVDIEEKLRDELKMTSYYPCLCVIVALSAQTNIPKPGGIQIKEGSISFLGDNQQKGISDTTVVTIHGNEYWSREHYNEDDQIIMDKLIDAAKPLLGEGQILDKQLKRWRYSKPEVLHPDEFVATTMPGPIAFAGDIFKRGAVEGAILSGLAASEWVLKN